MFILGFLPVLTIMCVVSGLSAQNDDSESILLKELQHLRNDFKRLENQHGEQIKDLTQANERLETRNEILGTRVSRLERELHALKQTNEQQKQQLQNLNNIQSQIQRLDEEVSVTMEECQTWWSETSERNESRVRKGRDQRYPESCCGADVVAFYSYMSHDLPSPTTLHTLVFDVVRTNVRNGYNQYSGVFTVPEDGVYVFIWKVRMYRATHSTELVVNQAVYGSTYLRESQGDDHSVTGAVVAQLTQGDVVFVRTHADQNIGDIVSNHYGYSSFSGWKLN